MASQRQTSHTKAAVAEISSLWPAAMPTIDRDSVVSMFTSKRSGASKHSSASSGEKGGKDLSERKHSCDEPREGEIRSHPVSAKTVFQKKKKNGLEQELVDMLKKVPRCTDTYWKTE